MLQRPIYRKTSRKGFQTLRHSFSRANAGTSLNERFEEKRTLQKMEMAKYFSSSLSNTNFLENLNKLVQPRTGKIKCWFNGKKSKEGGQYLFS